jgi:hypothetical protein
VRGSPASAAFTLAVMAESSTVVDPERGSVLTVRLLRTAVTPFVPFATSDARDLLADVSTKPFSWTVPLNVSTSIW